MGIIGSPRAGKNEIANFLVKHYNFKKIAFADQIKEEYFSKTGITEEKYEKLKKEGKCESVRKKLWDYSKGIKYANGQDHFIKIVFDKISQDNNWVITDIRTKFELECVLREGVTVIFVKRIESEESIKDSELSIGDIEKFDVIVNDQTMAILEENLKEYFGRKLMESEESYKYK